MVGFFCFELFFSFDELNFKCGLMPFGVILYKVISCCDISMKLQFHWQRIQFLKVGYGGKKVTINIAVE